MNLWIRTQDRTRLLKVNDIAIGDNGIEYYLVTNCNQSDFGVNYEILGRYKTKERVLEILDEVQNILHPKNIIYNCVKENKFIENNIVMKNENSTIEQFNTYVYEMPEE